MVKRNLKAKYASKTINVPPVVTVHLSQPEKKPRPWPV